MRALRIVAGEHNLNEESGLEQNRDVLLYLMHPRYIASTWEDDIAIILVMDFAELTVFILDLSFYFD